MAIVTVDQLKAQLNFTADIGSADDALLTAKIDAAQAHIERMLGYTLHATGPGAAPADLREAVLQLAAHWYEAREAAGDGLKEVPFGVRDIVMGRKCWSF